MHKGHPPVPPADQLHTVVDRPIDGPDKGKVTKVWAVDLSWKDAKLLKEKLAATKQSRICVVEPQVVAAISELPYDFEGGELKSGLFAPGGGDPPPTGSWDAAIANPTPITEETMENGMAAIARVAQAPDLDPHATWSDEERMSAALAAARAATPAFQGEGNPVGEVGLIAAATTHLRAKVLADFFDEDPATAHLPYAQDGEEILTKTVPTIPGRPRPTGESQVRRNRTGEAIFQSEADKFTDAEIVAYFDDAKMTGRTTESSELIGDPPATR